jgi:hypothetical protein
MVRGGEKNEKNEKNPCFGTILREKARAKWNEWVTFISSATLPPPPKIYVPLF